MAFLLTHIHQYELTTRADWTAQILDQDKIVVLFINYMFFSVIVLMCMLFLVFLTQIATISLDIYTLMLLLALCFIMTNIIVADYLVHTMLVNRDIKVLF